MTSVRKGLENGIYGKWERWRNTGADGVGRALSVSEHWLKFIALLWFRPQCEPDIPSNTHLVCSLYTTTHTHMRPSGHVNLFSHDSRSPFHKKKGTSARVLNAVMKLPSSACCAYHFGRRPLFQWLVPNWRVHAVNCEQSLHAKAKYFTVYGIPRKVLSAVRFNVTV